MPAQTTKKFLKGIPYDYSCPSVDQVMIKRRMCSYYDLYFSSRRAKSLHGASAESLKVVLTTQQSVCHTLRFAALRQRKLLCVMPFQVMKSTLVDEVDAEGFDLSNITDDENEKEFGTPVFGTDDVVPVWSDETEGCMYLPCTIG